MRYRTGRTSVLSLAVLLGTGRAFAINVRTGTDDFTLNVTTNLQLRLEGTVGGLPPTATSGAAPSGHLNTDIFLRRASLAIGGTAYKIFTYYLKLETGRFGARGNYSNPSLIQDMYLGYVPFMYFNIAQTNSLEGVADILLYPNARAQRQDGLQVRGLLFDQRFLIRGGIYEGARTGVSGGNPTTPSFQRPFINPNGWPMLAGMVRLNLIGYETSYTYPAIYLDGTSHMSVGTGGQWQSHSGAARADGTVNDYLALAADFYADMALAGDTEALLILDGYRFDYGVGATKTGYGAHGEVGFRVGFIEPEANFYWFNSDTKVNSFLRWGGGLNFYIKGHHAKIMTEYSNTIANGTLPNSPGHSSTPWLHQVLLQAQLAF